MTAPTAKLTQGPVRTHLVSLTVPMVWGIAAMMSFNIVDTWFVARLGERALAAISFTFPVTMVMISLGIGLMAGTASVISRVLGEVDVAGVRRLTTDAVLLAVIVSAACSIAGLLTMDPLFRALGAEAELLPLIRDYMTVWYAGFVFFLVPMVGFGAMRAMGDSKLQGILMTAVSVLNLVLDPLLIFGLAGLPRLEMQGAALATVIARGLSLVVGYWALTRRTSMIAFDLPSRAAFRQSCRRLLHVGLPAAGTNMIIPMATGIVVALVAQFGTNAVGGYGAATRVEHVTLVVYYAMSAMIGPFVGQNLGARRYERIEQAIDLCWRFCLWSGLAIAAVLIPLGPWVMAQFGDDGRVIGVGVAYLWIVPVSFGMEGVVMVMNAAFNGAGRPLPAVIISLTRMLVLYVPLGYVFSRIWGVNGIFAAATVANITAGLLALTWFKRWHRRFS